MFTLLVCILVSCCRYCWLLFDCDTRFRITLLCFVFDCFAVLLLMCLTCLTYLSFAFWFVTFCLVALVVVCCVFSLVYICLAFTVLLGLGLF